MCGMLYYIMLYFDTRISDKPITLPLVITIRRKFSSEPLRYDTLYQRARMHGIEPGTARRVHKFIFS